MSLCGLALGFAAILAFQGNGLGATLVAGALIVGGPLAILVHEAGHALAGMLLGARILLVKLGSGAPRWRGSVRGIPIQLGRYPVGGLTAFVWPGPWRRWRRLALVLAGPAANLAVGAALFGGVEALSNAHRLGLEIGQPLLFGLAAVQVLGALLNLIPFKQTDSEPMSDARHAWMLLTYRPSQESPVEVAIAAARVQELLGRMEAAAGIMRRAAALNPDDPEVLGFALHCIAAAEGHGEAMKFYRERQDAIAVACANPDAGHAIPWLQVIIAWTALLAGKAADLALADRLSEAAIEARPDAAPMLGARGGVLLAQGLADQAHDLLLRAVRGTTSARDKAGFCDELARCERASGDEAAAEAFESLGRHILSSGSVPA